MCRWDWGRKRKQTKKQVNKPTKKNNNIIKDKSWHPSRSPSAFQLTGNVHSSIHGRAGQNIAEPRGWLLGSGNTFQNQFGQSVSQLVPSPFTLLRLSSFPLVLPSSFPSLRRTSSRRAAGGCTTCSLRRRPTSGWHTATRGRRSWGATLLPSDLWGVGTVLGRGNEKLQKKKKNG